jgi:hypothetical protein
VDINLTGFYKFYLDFSVFFSLKKTRVCPVAVAIYKKFTGKHFLHQRVRGLTGYALHMLHK